MRMANRQIACEFGILLLYLSECSMVAWNTSPSTKVKSDMATTSDILVTRCIATGSKDAIIYTTSNKKLY